MLRVCTNAGVPERQKTSMAKNHVCETHATQLLKANKLAETINRVFFGHGGVANPRDTYGYRCGLRLAISKNPSVLNVRSSMQHYTCL